MNSTKTTDLKQPTLMQAIGAILVAAIMWGSGNVLSRSLLIEGVNEIFLVTLRVTLIGSILFLNYFLFIREKFQVTIFKVATLYLGAYFLLSTVARAMHCTPQKARLPPSKIFPSFNNPVSPVTNK